MDCTIFVINGPSTAGLGLGGEGVPVVLDRRADRRGRHDAADVLPPAAHRRSSAACGSFDRESDRMDQDAARPRDRHGDLDREAPDVPGGAAAGRPARDGRRAARRRAGPGLRPARGGPGRSGAADERRRGPAGAARADHARAAGA